MSRDLDLRTSARGFVIEALKRVSGKVPLDQVIESAVEKIIKAFANYVREPESGRAAIATQGKVGLGMTPLRSS
jgi:hypothetical protein